MLYEYKWTSRKLGWIRQNGSRMETSKLLCAGIQYWILVADTESELKLKSVEKAMRIAWGFEEEN